MPSNSNEEQDEDNSISNGFLTFSVIGVGLGSLVGSFGISLALARKKNPDFSMRAIEGHESPSRLAARALGWGSLLAFSGVFGLVILTGYLCGVSSVCDKIRLLFFLP